MRLSRSGSPSFVEELCHGNTLAPGITTYQLSAGCTSHTCTDLAALAGPSVTTYDTDVVAAEANQDWGAVYTRTSQQITAQYLPNQFANLLNQQIESVGRVTAIPEPLTSPVIQYTHPRRAGILCGSTDSHYNAWRLNQHRDAELVLSAGKRYVAILV